MRLGALILILILALARALVLVACASDATSTTTTRDGGAVVPPEDDSGIADGSTNGNAGTCVAPKSITLGFSETGSTAAALDVTSVACGAPAGKYSFAITAL